MNINPRPPKASNAAEPGSGVDATSTIPREGNWTMFAQLLQSLEVQIEEGATPWPPDGKAPLG